MSYDHVETVGGKNAVNTGGCTAMVANQHGEFARPLTALSSVGRKTEK